MTNQDIDNSVDTELGYVVLWQYDNAVNLLSILDMFKEYFNESTKDLWDNWVDDVANIDTANAFGLSCWGTLLGIKRVAISDDMYRKLLKAKFYLMNSNGSANEINRYLSIIFGDKVYVVDFGADNDSSNNMAIGFEIVDGKTLTSEEQALYDIPTAWKVYPSGVLTYGHIDDVIFGFDGQSKMVASDPVVDGFDNSTFTSESENI